MKSIKLRPHHILCAQFFEGKGYNEAFIENMGSVLAELETDSASVSLISGCDELCSACPNNLSGVCSADEKVQAIDRRVIETLRLSIGDSISWEILCGLARCTIIEPIKLREVCGDCEWIDICLNSKAH